MEGLCNVGRRELDNHLGLFRVDVLGVLEAQAGVVAVLVAVLEDGRNDERRQRLRLEEEAHKDLFDGGLVDEGRLGELYDLSIH